MTSLGSLFSEAVVKIIFSPYRLPTKGKPYRCRLSQKTQKVCLAVSTTSPPLPPTAPSLEPPPGLPLPVERQHLSSRGVVCTTLSRTKIIPEMSKVKHSYLKLRAAGTCLFFWSTVSLPLLLILQREVFFGKPVTHLLFSSLSCI